MKGKMKFNFISINTGHKTDILIIKTGTKAAKVFMFLKMFKNSELKAEAAKI